MTHYDKVIYTAIFVEDTDLLLRQWELTTGLAPLAKRYAHHLTLRFKPSQDDIDLLSASFGGVVELHTIGFAADSQAQALAVSLDPALREHCANEHPHITVATDGLTPPRYSNELLAKHEARDRLNLPNIRGRIGWWDGKQARFDQPVIKRKVLV